MIYASKIYASLILNDFCWFNDFSRFGWKYHQISMIPATITGVNDFLISKYGLWLSSQSQFVLDEPLIAWFVNDR